MKRLLLGVLQLVLYLLMTILIVGVMYFSLRENNRTAPLLLVFFLLSVIAIPALHEAGHLLFGKIAGMHLVCIGFCGWIFRRNGNRTVVTFRWKNVLSHTAGSCRMYPRNTEKTKAKFALFASGGLLLQALYMIIVLPVVIITDNPFLWATIGITLPYCVYLFLVNLLPFSNDFDGAVLWGLLKDEPSQITLIHVFTVQGYLAQGFTPGEIDESLYFALPQLPEDDVNFALLQYYRYAYYLDKGELQKAIKCITRLEYCMEYIPSDYLEAVCCELVYTYSYLQKNIELAERYHAYVKWQKESIHATAMARASLAYAMLCGNETLYKESLEVLKRTLEEDLPDGVKKFEKKLFAELYGV